MERIDHFTMHRRAATAFLQLSDSDRGAIVDKLGEISSLPPQDWPAHRLKLPGEVSPIYLVRINDSLRVIIAFHGDDASEVLDIVRHETLENFAKAAAR